MLKISNSIASVTVLSSSPTYKLAPVAAWFAPVVDVGCGTAADNGLPLLVA